MKIIIVDDVYPFVKFATDQLRQAGLDVCGIIATYSMMTSDGQRLTEEEVLALVRSADVIFLDHNMPKMNGKELLEHWQGQGIDFTNKRVVGSSSGEQSYLKEQFHAGFLHEGDRVKQFLGL